MLFVDLKHISSNLANALEAECPLLAVGRELVRLPKDILKMENNKR